MVISRLKTLKNSQQSIKTLDLLRQVRVEHEQLDGLVVGAGGDQVARRVPGRAVDGAVVVLALLVEDGGGLGRVAGPHAVQRRVGQHAQALDHD